MKFVPFSSKVNPFTEKVPHFAFPGGYPLFYVVKSDDGENSCCPSCVNQNRVGKNVAGRVGHINWEDDGLYCDVCNRHIEPACETELA